MDKKEYLFKTFSRTNKKDDENYVINYLWTKINNLDIKPISQQYVIIKNKIFYLDLFFPSIELGVEVDEIGHKNRPIQDLYRANHILSALLEENYKNIEIKRIKTYDKSIEVLHQEIDELAKYINEKANSKKSIWLTLYDEVSFIKNKGFLSINDNVQFPTIHFILNNLFNLAIKSASIRKGSYDYKPLNNHKIWFPKRSHKVKGVEKGYQNWINKLSSDRKTITESHENLSKKSYLEKDGKIRIVFMKYKNNLGENTYRFLGLFKEDGTKKSTINNKQFVVKKYSFFNDRINIP